MPTCAANRAWVALFSVSQDKRILNLLDGPEMSNETRLRIGFGTAVVPIQPTPLTERAVVLSDPSARKMGMQGLRAKP